MSTYMKAFIFLLSYTFLSVVKPQEVAIGFGRLCTRDIPGAKESSVGVAAYVYPALAIGSESYTMYQQENFKVYFVMDSKLNCNGTARLDVTSFRMLGTKHFGVTLVHLEKPFEVSEGVGFVQLTDEPPAGKSVTIFCSTYAEDNEETKKCKASPVSEATIVSCSGDKDEHLICVKASYANTGFFSSPVVSGDRVIGFVVPLMAFAQKTHNRNSDPLPQTFPVHPLQSEVLHMIRSRGKTRSNDYDYDDHSVILTPNFISILLTFVIGNRAL